MIAADGEWLSFEPGCAPWDRIVPRLVAGHDVVASRVTSLVLRPYPSKATGAWRVEICLDNTGPYAGAEWYVREAAIVALELSPAEIALALYGFCPRCHGKGVELRNG